MKLTIQTLKADLIQRWKTAFDEIIQLDSFEKQIVKRKYSSDSRFNLKNYSSGKLPAGGKLLNKIPVNEISYYEYGLNDKNKPVLARLTDQYGSMGWIGFYRYQKDAVEYIEFCMGTKVPSSVERIQLKDENPEQVQSLKVNGRASYPIFSNMTKDQIIEKLINEKNHLIIDIKEMDYHNDGSIKKADAYALVPGIDEYDYELIYEYDTNRQLKKIVSRNEKWKDQITYIKPSGKSIQELSNDLAIRLADLTVSVLSDIQFDSPLFCVSLSYRYLDSYWPFASYVTTNDVKANIKRGDNSVFHFGEFVDP